jgi:2-methylisocitrate lyase-like PEP mutase family enzyme
MSSQAERAATFRALHHGEPFVIPNPWDVGSARVLAGLGFRALATTSSGFAFSIGTVDGQVSAERAMVHVADLAAATELPLSADLENGYGADPSQVHAAVNAAAAAGAVGGSIEDFDPAGYLYEPALATERIIAAVEAARSLGYPFTLTARAENHIRGNPDLADTISRLQAYEQAGADVLYAPGLNTAHELAIVCGSVGRPVNALAVPQLRVADMIAAGAQRISVGGSLAWVGVRALLDAATAVRDDGDLSALAADLPQWVRSGTARGGSA